MSTNETNPLYQMVNVFLPDGTWAGQFMDEASAKAWMRKCGHDVSKCEISRRRPETAVRQRD